MSYIDKSTQSCYSQEIIKRKVLPSVALSPNIYNLVDTVNNCQRSTELTAETLKLFKIDRVVVL